MMPTQTTAGAPSAQRTVFKQEAFVARYGAEWDAFEAWLQMRGDRALRSRTDNAAWQGLRDDAVPAQYRRLCQQLALARRRGYSPRVVERLQALTQQGHAVLYRAPPPAWRRALQFFVAEFPRLVRAQRGCLWISTLLFVLPLVATFFAIVSSPELAYSIHSPDQLAEFERMYDPADPDRKLGRESGDDLMMFGFYIYNNVSIALRTFAFGLLAGVGTLFVLVFNGLFIGSIAGHLQAVGHGDPFWRFVVGHGAPELTAIVIAGAAGMRIGLDLVAPGRRRRIDALIEGGRVGAKLCLGVFAMLVFAAFVEAFWSSIGWMPAWIKFSVGGALWLFVLLWLSLGGRGSLLRGTAAQTAERPARDGRAGVSAIDQVAPRTATEARAALPRQGRHENALGDTAPSPGGRP
jgi:uncharacterized membrane protein SpoIIM required for sporulation